eukprot:COSAG05_NODE_8376_length_708_cov_13049.261084_1_plen_55_part_10
MVAAIQSSFNNREGGGPVDAETTGEAKTLTQQEAAQLGFGLSTPNLVRMLRRALR